jgi:hypothetical protein
MSLPKKHKNHEKPKGLIEGIFWIFFSTFPDGKVRNFENKKIIIL